MRESLYGRCVRTGRQGLLAQWDGEKNLPLTPQDVSGGSRRKVWWRCENGHRWQAAVFSRTAGAGCPVCAGKLVLPGENDLAARFPALAKEWHPAKNLPLTPEQVTPGSHRTVWWVCREGHEWRTQIRSRTNGSGCPVCANREVVPGDNDLAVRFPALAKEWHPAKNGTLSPRSLPPGARRKVWWRCGKGHEWQASVAARAAGAGCPICAGKLVLPGENDLETMFPNIAAQWHPARNGALTPKMVTAYSNRRVWWRCEKGHDYAAAVSARTSHGTGCPYCAGRRVLPGFNDLAALFPQLAAQWHPALNGALTPEMVTAGSHKKVWWRCPEGHVWKAVIASRTGSRKCGCPVCAGRTRPVPDHSRQTAAPAAFEYTR